MKINKIIKNISLLSVICVLILTTFSGCITKEDMKQILENKRLAKNIIKNFVDEHYKGATVENIECIYPTGFGSSYHPSDYVSSDIFYNNKKFNLVVNVQTKEFYTNERKNELIESIEEKVSSEIDAVKPYKSEIMFQLKHLVYSSYEVGDDPNGAFFAKYDVTSADEMFESDDYIFEVKFSYVDSKPDLNKLNIERLYEELGNNECRASFINYHDKSRFEKYDARRSRLKYDHEASFGITTFYSDAVSMYSIDGARFTETGIGDVDGELARSNDYYKDDCFIVSHTKVNGFEFAWNSSLYDIEFSESPAEPIVEPDFEDNVTYTSASSNVVNLKIENNSVNVPPYPNSEIYVYFSEEMEYKYGLCFEDGKCKNSKPVNRKPLIEGPVYWYDIYEEVTKDSPKNISVGIYGKKAQENISGTENSTTITEKSTKENKV